MPERKGPPAVSALAESPGSLAVETRTDQSVAILTVGGVLDAANSAALRDSIRKAALDQPSAVIVDITALQVPAESALSAFIGAYLQLSAQATAPIVLVCGDRGIRDALTRAEVTRFMPVYSTEKGATKALANLTRLRESRRLVREWLTDWSRPAFIPVALVVVNVFVENVLEHTGSVPAMRIETDGATATIAVSDESTAAAHRLPSPPQGIDVSGLAIVDA